MKPHRAPTEQAAAEFARQWKADRRTEQRADWRNAISGVLERIGLAACFIGIVGLFIMIGGMAA